MLTKLVWPRGLVLAFALSLSGSVYSAGIPDYGREFVEITGLDTAMVLSGLLGLKPNSTTAELAIFQECAAKADKVMLNHFLASELNSKLSKRDFVRTNQFYRSKLGRKLSQLEAEQLIASVSNLSSRSKNLTSSEKQQVETFMRSDSGRKLSSALVQIVSDKKNLLSQHTYAAIRSCSLDMPTANPSN
jgi:hypothetical protein